MVLKAKKPASIEKRLKALFYGSAGVGKTTAAIQFPRPYLIDTEKGAENDQYVRLLEKSGGVIYQTTDFNELIIEVTSLLTQKHEYKTLVIDPLTTLYNDLLDKAANRVGTEFGRHYGEANKSVKHLMNLLLRLDMNVIITSHSKNEYGANLSVLGQTYDCYKKLDYLFDLVFEIQKRGKERIAIIKKSRVETLPDGDNFPFSYEEVAKRYGKAILERDATIEELATPEQVIEFKRLVELLKKDKDVIDKWLDKAGAESIQEMNNNHIQKCIEAMEKEIKGVK